ncbi:YafY family protein [Janthinobacterium sp.]|uniref:helix-turn-helix transcriptional regulator n=1 Tax=Janthinobacterium sp. TaxID=1871054 RepID=UPI00293D6ED4|nr:YafY family protein [Janthinobacterium sp.]
MSRAERLLELMQVLRRQRQPVGGAALAAELKISLRTLYRDIASLQAQGARIDAEAGVGYLLRPGFLLPPLMFSADELEALALGARWVARRADRRLGEAARDLMAKIAAVLPAELRHELEAAALLVGPAPAAAPGDAELAQMRAAIRAELKLGIVYRDLRGGFRHFRTDRIAALTTTAQRYPRRRQALLKEWRASQNIAAQ